MSKSLKNYPDPMTVVGKFGADALRLYLLGSPLMRAEDLNFSEKGVGEVYRKIIMRLSNVHSFYKMYRSSDPAAAGDSTNVLDSWIRARYGELVKDVTAAMENYEIDRAIRPIDAFIDDLSNWYLRRSRDRFKSDNESDRQQAMATTREILIGVCKILAPFAPFAADEIYRDLGGEKESVHLDSWPEANGSSEADKNIIEEMEVVRELVEMGLALRDKKGIKVRQPLAAACFAGGSAIDERLLSIVADEINVKEVRIVKDLALSPEEYEVYADSATGKPVAALSLVITPELKLEGDMRELVRSLQEQRKREGLKPGELADFTVPEEFKEVLSRYESEIKKAVSAQNISLSGAELKLIRI
jgi:isoleucyl-tRNA synthetase